VISKPQLLFCQRFESESSPDDGQIDITRQAPDQPRHISRKVSRSRRSALPAAGSRLLAVASTTLSACFINGPSVRVQEHQVGAFFQHAQLGTQLLIRIVEGQIGALF
jgi:hypothetical protein